MRRRSALRPSSSARSTRFNRSVAELQQKLDLAIRQAGDLQQKAEAAQAAATAQQQKADAAAVATAEQQRKLDAVKTAADAEQQKYQAAKSKADNQQQLSNKLADAAREFGRRARGPAKERRRRDRDAEPDDRRGGPIVRSRRRGRSGR